MAMENKPLVEIMDPDTGLLDVSKYLSLLPHGAQRVQIRLADGKCRYKKPLDVTPHDKPVFKKNGDALVMMSAPGRRLDSGDPDAAFFERKEIALKADGLFQLTRTDPGSDEIFNYCLRGLAEEQASIAFAREESERTSSDLKTTSTISNRRVQALKALTDSFLKRKEQMSGKAIDMRSPAFQQLFVFIVETFQRAMRDSGMDQDTLTVTVSKFSRLVSDDSWEKEARTRMGRLG